VRSHFAILAPCLVYAEGARRQNPEGFSSDCRTEARLRYAMCCVCSTPPHLELEVAPRPLQRPRPSANAAPRSGRNRQHTNEHALAAEKYTGFLARWGPQGAPCYRQLLIACAWLMEFHLSKSYIFHLLPSSSCFASCQYQQCGHVRSTHGQTPREFGTFSFRLLSSFKWKCGPRAGLAAWPLPLPAPAPSASVWCWCHCHCCGSTQRRAYETRINSSK
jgi:hypothetical protein